MPRKFTLQQAEALLPELEKTVRRALAIKAEYTEVESKLASESRRIAMSGGAFVNREELVSAKARRDKSAARLNEAIENVHEFGCEVKDLDIGLVDFPTDYRGEVVLLCWKLGETAIRYWHRVEEGFRGRKRIDQEFLDNHKGDSPN